MNKASATQLTFDYSGAETNEAAVGSAIQSPDIGAPLFNAPTFSGYGEVYALASRRAGRINAAAISEEEHAGFLSERKRLLEKKFAEGLTRKEANRLEYVRWSLDRIEDAKYGSSLDMLESTVSQYERFFEDIRSLQDQISALDPAKRK